MLRWPIRLSRLIVEVASPGEEILSPEDKLAFSESFEAIWKQLNGTRVALYRNQGEIGTGGELALVAIFDASDPSSLLGSLPGLVEFANAGIMRITPEGQEPDIQFSYQPQSNHIGGLEDYPVDVLKIDTSRISDDSARRFTRFFGEDANQIHFVALEGHVVMFLGTNPEVLLAAVDNLANGKPGLASHPAIVAANEKIDARRKIELHFSARNFNYIYSAMIRERQGFGKIRSPRRDDVPGADHRGGSIWL